MEEVIVGKVETVNISPNGTQIQIRTGEGEDGPKVMLIYKGNNVTYMPGQAVTVTIKRTV